MAKALTLKELGDLDAALKRAGMAMTKNVSVKLGQQSELPTTTEVEGSDKPVVKRGPKPKEKTPNDAQASVKSDSSTIG
jgi:hypothetical protein